MWIKRLWLWAVLPALVFWFSYVVLKTFSGHLPAPHFTQAVWLGLGGAICFTSYALFLASRTSKDWSFLLSVPLTLGYVAFVIACFGMIYVDLGIMTADHKPVHDPASCLYFSAVAFTTLGYGDLIPSEATRFVAALEALWGYFTLGIVVAVGANLLSSWRR
jgi:Ion channel